MKSDTRHNLFRVFLYVGIFLSIAYFFGLIIDANKKITYLTNQELNLSTVKKATILDNEKNLLIEDKEGKLFIVEGFDKNMLDKNQISYGYENVTLDKAIKYGVSVALFVMVLLLAVT